ncbi:MAG: restriction endonuclease subunit S, partial [Candidatus Saccharibacteria bacterium]|nr:restriction endonuclease subunit S [Candidatus Saccharibacteria bacterium]
MSWEYKTLGEVGTVARGKSKHRPRNDESLYGGAYPFVQTGDVKHSGLYLTDYSQTYNEKGLAQSKLWPEDTLCITIAANIADTAILGMPACFPDSILGFIPDEEKSDVRFVKYCFDLLQINIQKMSQGSTQDNLSLDKLDKIQFSFPQIAEQKKIAAVLSALDDKIALNKKMNQKLEAMAKRLYDYWFVQFDFPDENGRPYKTSGGPMTHNPTLKREIPTGWEVTRLGDLFKTNRGVSYSTPTLGTEGDGVPMINLASFSPNESYNEKGIKYYKGDYTDEKVLKPFDFVMCNTQQTAIDPQKDIIGRSMLVPDIFDGDIVSSHHVNTIKLEKENLKFYLNRLFNTKFYHAYISKFANGTNILGLIFSGVEDYMCEIPSDDLLEKFAKISLDIEKKKSKIIKENQKLTALRDKL